ncbi:flagellar export protein FliJ [Halobacillus salinarum]|uniref:Flagellar FliJ protein n=1 Tax=Halobacillus salinarum TaxID=2932257 RepID=A0ABY4EGN6_9BACI|nr:flagellar export protein FliJ [Halobacillus salinarum]UOQ43053.1 flagellar export protein FliJ [Halobacillus salinarum]
MARIETFQKIKDLKERDKNEHMKAYRRSVESFEQVATELYETLKEKEQAEDNFYLSLEQKKVPAVSFIQHQQYIQRLDEKAEFLQPRVQTARTTMESSQAKLTDAHVEMKKFQKLIERRIEKDEQGVKEAEAKHMDELSMNQFLNYKNR